MDIVLHHLSRIGLVVSTTPRGSTYLKRKNKILVHLVSGRENVPQSKINHQTKLDIVQFYRKGLNAHKILRILEERGLSITSAAVKYHIKQYQIGNFNIDIQLPPYKFMCTTRRTAHDNQIIKEVLSNDATSSSTDVKRALTLFGTYMSNATVKRAICDAGYVNAQPRCSQLIRDVNKLKRIEFCKSLLATNDTLDVIFSDECSIQLHQNKITSYRQKDTLTPHFCKPKHPLKVHVWGGISRKGATCILIFDGIMNADFVVHEILERSLLTFIHQKFDQHHRFQQDNDTKHKSKLAKKFMEENGIYWWNEWPSESCDLNPIEMVWNQMKRHTAKKEPRTKEELILHSEEFWSTVMTAGVCSRYIDHVYKVVPVCLVLNGKARGDFPKRLLRERSSGKSIRYFYEQLQTEEMQNKIRRLLERSVTYLLRIYSASE